MNIELKKVKTFTGNEGTGLNAEVWVDGVKTCYVVDDASGSVLYDFTVYDKPMFKKLEDHVKSIPSSPMVIDGVEYKKDGQVVMIDPTIESLIDEVFEKMQKAKELKKLEKKFVNCLIWGKEPFDGKYKQIKFPNALASYSTLQLQGVVNKYKKELKADERFYNTNFEALKITL